MTEIFSVTVNRTSRLVFIDLLRGLAILAMVETHVFNAFLDTANRSKEWFNHLNYYNGLVAPSFLFVSGWVFIKASQRKVDDFRSFGPAFRKQLWRIAQIWILGYCLHFPKYSYSIVRHWTSEEDWQRFYTVDILHCIAVGLLVLLFARILFVRPLCFEGFLWMGSAVVVLITPWVWELRLPDFAPVPLAGYFQEGVHSYFPLFPWLGFFGIGAALGQRYVRYEEAGKEHQFFAGLGTASILLIAAGHWLHLFHFQIYYGSSNVRAQPHFWAMRLGYLLALAVFCRLLQHIGIEGKNWLQLVSRESLMVYVVHLFLIYRFPLRQGTLYDVLGQSMSTEQCVIMSLGMIFLMILLAKIWSWMKYRHPKPFRLGLSIGCVLIVVVFFIR